MIYFRLDVYGLIKAIDNFDLSQNVQFSTYAVPMIIGEVRRYLRDNNSIRVSRSVRDLAYKVLAIKEKYSKEMQKDITVEEVAKELNVEGCNTNSGLTSRTCIRRRKWVYISNGSSKR